MQSLNGAATILFPTEYQCPDEAAPGSGADRLERDAFPATLAATRAPPTQTIAMATANTSAVLDSLVLAGFGGFMVLPQWGHNPRHGVLFREMRSGAADGAIHAGRPLSRDGRGSMWDRKPPRDG